MENWFLWKNIYYLYYYCIYILSIIFILLIVFQKCWTFFININVKLPSVSNLLPITIGQYEKLSIRTASKCDDKHNKYKIDKLL
jgi:cellulose synthase/poly-beta-1,6-N-acetylglucosamine synthase-like glycosyltransferase